MNEHQVKEILKAWEDSVPETDRRSIGKIVKGNKDRFLRIRSIIRSGKIARFAFDHGGYKDVKSFKLSKHGDMVAFRKKGCLSDYVCWDSPKYTIFSVNE